MSDNEKRCKVCKRILVGESKTGLCPSCANKAGTGGSFVGIAALAMIGKVAWKNKENILKVATKIVRK